MPIIFRVLTTALLLLSVSKIAQAEVTISEAWVRATAPGQKVGAAYMTLQSPQATTLIEAKTKSADEVEIHSMSMTDGIMKMRKLQALNLQPNKPEKLAPGGFHLMLFGLKAPLKAGDNVTLTLSFKDEKEQISYQDVTLPIKDSH